MRIRKHRAMRHEGYYGSPRSEAQIAADYKRECEIEDRNDLAWYWNYKLECDYAAAHANRLWEFQKALHSKKLATRK